MKKSRRLVSLLIALFLAFGCFSFGAFAAGTPVGNESMQVVVSADKETAYAEEYVTVTFNVKNNYNATCMRFPVLFTGSIFEVDNAQFNLQKLGSLITLPGSLGANTASNPAFYPAGYSASEYGAVLIQWVGGVQSGTYGCYNQPSGQDCFSFRLKIKQGASGVGTILIPSGSNLFYYQAMNNPNDGNSVYTMSADSCLMTFTPDTVTAASQAPDIAAVAGSTTVIDRENGFIYGLMDGLTSLDGYVEPIGGATLQVIASDEGHCGTGTVVNVLAGEAVVKTFIVVIFGDVNGDCAINAVDDDTCNLVQNWMLNWDPDTQAHYYKAGDINVDGRVDSVDADLMSSYANWIVSIDQTTGMAIGY